MILIVDDDKTIRLSLGLLLKRAGYEVDNASDPEEALSKVRHTDYDLILMDMNYSLSTTGEEGIELLRKVKIFLPDTPVILITAWGSIELAVEGMRHGAFDFITKPWNNRLLLQRVATALSLRETPKREEVEKPVFNRAGIIGRDKALTDLLATVERIAPTDAPVLILGENGTGKEMIANAIHLNSRRKENPFVMVNLGGISQSLFESEMFGHVKGAFTGAVAARKGRFEMADKGTIFLDEIGDLDMSCQVKLLRVLQQHTFEALGDSRPKRVDIRAVCATNADLPAMVSERTFREDLYYRINLITLRLPPLRERRDDIPLLVNHFVKDTAAKMGIAIPEIPGETMEYLTRLPYPGNIRQLKNMVERAVLIGDGKLDRSLFGETPNTGVDSSVRSIPSNPTLDEVERNAIAVALERSGGNLTSAARYLGITRQTLYRRMDKYGFKR
ncbi:MAG: sigma-54-dependent Fis family transcriptional regulator [Bacteroides sp.]|nr:sigma-54-dependent Fis family transcriptional regulator [Bacteroides sp.]